MAPNQIHRRKQIKPFSPRVPPLSAATQLCHRIAPVSGRYCVRTIWPLFQRSSQPGHSPPIRIMTHSPPPPPCCCSSSPAPDFRPLVMYRLMLRASCACIGEHKHGHHQQPAAATDRFLSSSLARRWRHLFAALRPGAGDARGTGQR